MSSSEDKTLLSCQGLSTYRGKQLILENVSLAIKQGEIVTVIGPNGAGKSTLMKTLLKLEPPSSGEITYNPSLKIGYMPQRLNLDPSLPITVKRFLLLTLERFASRQLALSQMEKMLVQVGAPHLAERMMSQLSGGELQRVLLARALMTNPSLLILDEPAQGLDISGQNQFYQLIGKLRDENSLAILLVSHDLHFVMAGTDQVVCLNQHVCCSGHPNTVSNDPAYQALFDVVPHNQFAIYNHHHDHHHQLDGNIEHKDCDHD